MTKKNYYMQLCFFVFTLLQYVEAYAGIDIDGGNDHAKDFEVVNSLGRTTQTILFDVGGKMGGSICGFCAILFLAKRRYGICAIFIISSIAFFASKALVANFSNFA